MDERMRFQFAKPRGYYIYVPKANISPLVPSIPRYPHYVRCENQFSCIEHCTSLVALEILSTLKIYKLTYIYIYLFNNNPASGHIVRF